MSTERKKLIGERIKQLRETQGYTSKDLANNMGIAEIQLYQIEAGNFSFELFPLLASILRTLEHSIKLHWAEHKGGLYLK